MMRYFAGKQRFIHALTSSWCEDRGRKEDCLTGSRIMNYSPGKENVVLAPLTGTPSCCWS